MGYFIQITNDAGSPIFQAVRNYPDVSFASSALFHALATASLEQGFVPSVLRANDASIMLAVHGQPGSRLGLALVTSELTTGRTADLETRLRYRLDAIYQAAVLAVGHELLAKAASGQVQAEPLRRLLAQRVTPIVAHVMAEGEDREDMDGEDREDGGQWHSEDDVTVDADSAGTWEPHLERVHNGFGDAGGAGGEKGLSRRLEAEAGATAGSGSFGLGAPRLGLQLCGSAVEWLALGCSATAELVLDDLLAGLAVRGQGSSSSSGPATAHMAVLSWRGRVLAATPAWKRVVALDRGLLLAMADGAGPACFGQCRSLSLEEVVDLWPRIRPAATSSRALAKSAGSELEDAKRQRHRMLSVRLYPPEELSNLPANPSQPSCCRSLTRREESSLVLSLIHEVGGGEKTGGSAADVKLEALLESAGRPA
ncbi:unnamed protein product, partial [Polarella glacialis]